MSTEINIRKRIDIQEEGVSITPDVSSINFIGAGVTASTVGDNVTVNVQGSVGATAYYLNETVTQAPYKEFSSIPTAAAEQTIATVIGVGATATIQSFQTPSGVPNTTNIPAGLWQFYLHFSGTLGDSWDVYAEVYKRDLGGIETLLLTTDVIPTTTLTAIPTMILTDGVFPASTVLTTDRIVVKVLAINTGVAGQTITFHTEGSTNYSVGTTTLNQIVPTGAVTNVTGTAPVVSSGGTTPAISMPQANGTTDGYLDSADWTTFNNKVDDNIYTADGTLGGNRTVTMSSNTLNFSGGNVGINQPTPTVPLHIKSTAIPSTNEDIIRLEVSDAPTAYLAFNNASLTNGEFVPEVVGRQGISSTQSAIYQGGYIDATQDSGTTPVTVFRSALVSLTQVVTRPLFAFRNWSTTVMTILADGKVGIGTTTPSTPLQVRSTAIPSAGEAIARFDVSDSSAYLQVANGTSTNSAFAPVVQGRQVGTSTQSALQTEGIIDSVDDTGTTPVTIFKTRLATLAQVVTRPVFQFSNWTSEIMTMLADGNVGIGTTTPTAKLEVNGPAFPGIESVAKFTVSDDLASSLEIKNGTNTPATFIPEIRGTNSTNRTALGTSGVATTDTGTEAVTVFQSVLASLSAVVTRPIFQWKNFSTNVMTILANGNVGIGTTTPGEKLEVNGKTKTTTFQMTTTPTAGYVLTSDASGNGTWNPASDTNIYNSDGTLSADRTVTMNNFGLTFNGAGGANGSQINISAAANRAKALNFTVGSGLRWKQQVSGVEIGGDIGSQLAMLYYDDAGALKGTAFSISRTDGAFRLNNAYSLPLSGGTTGQVLTSTTLGLTAFQSLPAEIQVAASNETTNLTTGTAKVTFRMPYAMTLTAVRASLSTAQTAGALLTVDINLNGVSVLGTKLTFDNTEKTTVTAATPPTIVTSALTDDGEITVDIDAVGTAGARGLKITLIGTRA